MKLQAIVLLIVIANFHFQEPVPTQPSTLEHSPNVAQQDESDKLPPSDVDWQIQSWLNDGPGAVQRLVGLGVDQETARSFVDSFQENDLHIQWKSLRSESTEHSAVMFLPCNGLEGANLFAMKKGNTSWQVTDQASFDCHYDDSVSMETAQIRDPKHDEILIHHACQEHGTGFIQQNYMVFSLVQGKLKLRMDTDEALDDHQPSERLHDIVRRSTFTIVPIVHSRARAIEETRSSTLNGYLIVQRRVFRWDAAKEHYLPSLFTQVSTGSTN